MDCETPAVEALYTCRMTEGWRVIIIPISCVVVWHKHTVLLEQINYLLNCIKQSGCIIHCTWICFTVFAFSMRVYDRNISLIYCSFITKFVEYHLF